MKKKTMANSLLLFLAACIWGVAFVAQSVGMDYMGPFTFNGARFLIGGTVLLPVLFVRKKGGWHGGADEKGAEAGKEPDRRKIVVKGGICCGLAICAASLFQQIGIQYTTVGKAGFITTLYIILVPFFGLFLHKRVPGIVWIAAVTAAFGMYLLCVTEGFRIGKGDAFVFVCAVLFSVHILVIDYFSPKADGVALSCIQFFTAGILCAVGAFVMERPSWEQLAAGMVPVYFTNHWAKGTGAGGGFADSQYGIGSVRSGRVDAAWPVAKRPRAGRVRACLRGGNPCAALSGSAVSGDGILFKI